MSQTEVRRLVCIVAAAFVLRLTLAAITENHPLFPPYYYTDANLIDDAARRTATDVAAGRPYSYAGTPSQRLQVRIQTALYRGVGIHPFAMKTLNCALSALAIGALAVSIAAIFGPAPSLAAAALCAAWPSSIFYTSQNFKEAPISLLVYLALCAFLPLLRGRKMEGPRTVLLAAFGSVCLIAAAFYRSYVTLALSSALAAAFSSAWVLNRWPRRPLMIGLGATLLAPLLYLPVSRYALTYDSRTEHAYSPASPLGLSEFRRIRQSSDRQWAKRTFNRDIGTQIYPDARFETWPQLAAFLPKSAFTALFMPLPGLYPMDGKLGRMLAAAENIILLALAALGLAGCARGPKTPARAALFLFFAAMTTGAALFEFDLGSAGRHKLLYLPMLFPFAIEEALRLFQRKK